jgi:hypothetical protein
MFRLQSNRPCRHDVLDDHLAVLHHNPIDDELSYLLLHGERRFLHGLSDTGAKSVDPVQESALCTPLAPLVSDCPHPFPPHPPVVFNPSAALRECGQLNHLGLIGLDQARHFSVEGGAFALQAYAFLFCPDIHGWVPVPLRIWRPQHGRVRAHCLHMVPDPCLNHGGTETAAGTRPRHIPRVPAGTASPSRPAPSRCPPCAGHSAHRPGDFATDTDAACCGAAPARECGRVALAPAPRSRDRCAPAPGPESMRSAGVAYDPGHGQDGDLCARAATGLGRR